MTNQIEALRREVDAGKARALAATKYHRVVIQGRSFPFTSFEEVSRAYRATIERLGVGGSKTPQCSIFDAAGNQTAYLSYNGRAWAGSQRDWQPGGYPLYAPNGFYGDFQDLPRIDCVPQSQTVPALESVYLAPRYVEVDQDGFRQYEKIDLKYGGSLSRMTEDAGWAGGISFVAGSAGAAPQIGDLLLITAQGRLDGFQAEGRFFVLYES